MDTLSARKKNTAQGVKMARAILKLAVLLTSTICYSQTPDLQMLETITRGRDLSDSNIARMIPRNVEVLEIKQNDQNQYIASVAFTLRLNCDVYLGKQAVVNRSADDAIVAIRYDIYIARAPGCDASLGPQVPLITQVYVNPNLPQVTFGDTPLVFDLSLATSEEH